MNAPRALGVPLPSSALQEIAALCSALQIAVVPSCEVFGLAVLLPLFLCRGKKEGTFSFSEVEVQILMVRELMWRPGLKEGFQ